MDEFTLSKKLKALQSVKPDKKWVDFAKANIVSQEFEKGKSFSISHTANQVFGLISNLSKTPQLVAVYSSITAVVFGGFMVLSVARNAVPGDMLYAVKQAEENIKMAMIISPEQKSVVQIEQASTRLDELDIVSKQVNNEEKKLAAISETKKAIAEATREIAKLSGDQQASLIEKLAIKIQTVEKNSNAVIMDKDESSFESIYKYLAESEIKEFDDNAKNLTVKQRDLLEQAKDFFAVNKYSDALDVLYQIQPDTNDEEAEDENEEVPQE